MSIRWQKIKCPTHQKRRCLRQYLELEAVFRTRVFPQNPVGLKMTEEEIRKGIQSINSLNDLVEYFIQKEEIRKGIQSINSLNDLVEYFIQKDKEEPHFQRDILGIGRKIANKIDNILKV